VNGSGTLLGLVIKGKAAGSAKISIVQVNARDSQQKVIPLVTGEAQFRYNRSPSIESLDAGLRHEEAQNNQNANAADAVGMTLIELIHRVLDSADSGRCGFADCATNIRYQQEAELRRCLARNEGLDRPLQGRS